MNLTAILAPILEHFWWWFPCIFLIRLLQTRWFKGLFGEAIVKLATRLYLPSATYHTLHNVTLPTLEGTTQIDHLIVSPYGIFVIETKHMKGWIFGGENDATWTQSFRKKSFRFQNPLRQNYKHLKSLESTLNVPFESLHSVIAFTGEAQFKTPMPQNVRRSGYLKYIKSFKTIVFQPDEIQQILSAIASHRLPANGATTRQHIKNLRQRFHAIDDPSCPRCGKPMRLRTAKKGANAGTQFWGCSAFPHCKAVHKLSQTS